MRFNCLLIPGLAAVLWMGAGMAQETGAESAPPTAAQETPATPEAPVTPAAPQAPSPAPVAATPVTTTPSATWTSTPSIDVSGGEIRLGTIQVSQARDHASYLSTPFGTIMPQSQQRAFEGASTDQVVPQSRWGNLEHLTGATYGSAIRIGQSDIERKTSMNLWDAVKGEPGMRVDTSGRRASEGTISIRGSSRYQVGMYIDDVPVATAWRNEFDASNYLLYDLDSIEITKGFTSPLLGTNNGLAGVVNMRSAKPTEKIEAKARYINFFDRDFSDQGRMVAASVGSRQEKFYFKVTGILDEQDYFLLPNDFTPGRYEDGGRRDNYNARNRSIHALAGWTPNDRVDIMFGFVRQIYEKGEVFNAARGDVGFNLNSQGTRYVFNFPDYSTTRYYMNANFQLTDKLHLKAVAYYDDHVDRSDTIDSQGINEHWFAPTRYLQYTAGGNVRADYTFNDMHQVSASVGYRRLSHEHEEDYGKKYGPGYQNAILARKYVEDYTDLGGEYTFRPIQPLAFTIGGSYNHVKPKQMLEAVDMTNQPNVMENIKEGVLGESNHLTSWQLGAFYDITENHQVYATFARKARFASMRERYSRGSVFMGSTVDPEHANHWEIGYRGVICDWLQINSSIYYSSYKDKIMQGTAPNNLPYHYNLGRVKFYGFEFAAEGIVNDYFRFGANFSVVKGDNVDRTNNDWHLTNLPTVTSTLYAVIQPTEKLSIIPQIDICSKFYRETNRERGFYTKSPGFVTADIKAVYDVNDHFTVEAGARNIFDKEYAYSAYYPQQGRNFFLGITAKW